jgi:intein/homing endonuclease
MTTINTYQNGNTTVTLMSDGTKIREYEGVPLVLHPESIDIKITDYCDMGCSYCFLPDSVVLTPNGNIRIDEINIGDSVYSRNLDNLENEIKVVCNLFTREINEEIVIIELENGEFIKCTDNHEIFTENRGWIKAMDLSVIDILCNFL